MNPDLATPELKIASPKAPKGGLQSVQQRLQSAPRERRRRQKLSLFWFQLFYEFKHQLAKFAEFGADCNRPALKNFAVN